MPKEPDFVPEELGLHEDLSRNCYKGATEVSCSHQYSVASTGTVEKDEQMRKCVHE